MGASEFCGYQPANECAWHGRERMNALVPSERAFMHHTIFHANSFAGSSGAALPTGLAETPASSEGWRKSCAAYEASEYHLSRG
jgi:hypothetical protein